MGGKSNDVTVGYRYFMDLHFGICHGPVDALAEIRVGDRTAYATEITGSTEIYINSPKLFGGDKREGGIQGYADVLGGTSTQGVNEYLQEKIGADARVPAFRGLFSLVYKGGLVSSNNPYIKPWAFKVRRILSGWGGYQQTDAFEYSNSVLYPWVSGSKDPRNCKNDHEYRFDPPGAGLPTSWGTLESALTAAESYFEYSLSRNVLGWSRSGVSGLSPLDSIDPGESEVIILHFNKSQVDSIGDSNFYGAGQVVAAGGNTSLNPSFGVLFNLGAPRNTFVWAYARAGSTSSGPGSMYFIDPAPAGPGGPDDFSVLNNCITAFGCPYTNGDQLFGLEDARIEVRRKIRAPDDPCAPRCEDPYPDFPDNPAYCLIDTLGVKRGGWALTSGTYKALSLYATGGSPTAVTRYPLNPVLPDSDANYSDEDYWTGHYNAAVTAGELPAGLTYSSTGTGGVGTYPRILSPSAYVRDGGSILEGEPPDAGIAQIGDDMNPAHIVRQCITNAEWGMGYPDALIGDSFTTCAQALYDEEFGLSFQWTQQEPVEDFIGQVLNHCGGVWYADPRTGKFEMALIRDDYDLSDLPTFDESNILAVESYQKPGYGELVNEITVVWTDVPNNKAATTAPLQDPACIQAQGSVISEVRQYPGITKAALAQRVALRDLTAASTPLASIKLKVNREGWDLIPGKDCIILSWQKLGITQLVCRVLKVDRGTLEDGVVTLEVAEDVFGLPDAVYTTQESEEWTDPNVEPDDLTAIDLVESPYWDLARNLSAADLDYTDADAGYVFTLAGRNSDVETSYGIWSRTGSSDYEDRGVGPYAATALLNGAIDQQETTINLDNGVDLDDVSVGDRVLIGSGRLAEFCEVLSLDTTTGVMTVSRAVLDTTPQEHEDNTRVWFVENSFGIDQTERATSDEVDVKLTAIATGGESDLEDATEQTITMNGRFGRPYPPGKVRINGDPFPVSVDTTEDASEGFVITWAHRDRLQQTADFVTQSEDSIGPEAGTTYAVELYNDTTDVLYDSVSGISGTSLSMTVTDSFFARLEIYSVRDGVESWQRQVRRFALLGTDVFVSEDGDHFITEDGQILAPE